MVVILCRFLAYSKKNSLTLPAICVRNKTESGSARSHQAKKACKAHLDRRQSSSPLLDKLDKQRVRAALLDLAQPTVD